MCRCVGWRRRRCRSASGWRRCRTCWGWSSWCWSPGWPESYLISPKKGPIVHFLGLFGVLMQTLSLSDALFTATQQRILGLLFGKPDHSFYANEIARWAKVGKGSLMRELERLQRADI